MANSISNSYSRFNGAEEQRKKDRASGKLVKKSDLEGTAGYTGGQEGETYVETEREYQKRNPNSAEYRVETEKRKQERFDLENKQMEKMNRLKRDKPWLFGYGAGAMQTKGISGL